MKEKLLIAMTCCCMALLSCGGKGTKAEHEETPPDSAGHAQQASAEEKPGQVCWRGTLDSKVNVLLHYQIEDNVLVGELTYLDTKEKKPIKILGTIDSYEDFREYRLLEFEESGNVTGIITGLPAEDEFTGSWFSPKTGKELAMKLKRVDTLISSTAIDAGPDALAGSYYYQYGEEADKGELEVDRVDAQHLAFSALTLTASGNIASTGSLEDDPMPKDTVALNGNGFVYRIPESGGCEIRVRFFRDFAVIDFTPDSDCGHAFGYNATLEGVFVKKRK